MSKQENPDSVFYSTFVGEDVFITMSTTQTNRIMLANDTMTEDIPMFFEGILMDLDDKYLYLGDGQKITSSVKEYFILHIELRNEAEDKYKKILESVNPTSENDFN